MGRGGGYEVSGVTRKSFLAQAGALAALGAGGARAQQNLGWQMPDESAPHKRTWMAFGAQEPVWGKRLHRRVQADLALIARTIAKFEPVHMLVRSSEREAAKRLLGDAVTLIDAELDDLWARDSGPSFVVSREGQLGGVDLNFNGWGKKQVHQHDAELAELISEESGAAHLATELVGEGGGIEVDGHGTAILTESCFLNANRNPGMSKRECEEILRAFLGIRKVIWLPGMRGQDITDGHTDFYARFARPGVVVAGLEMDRNSPDYRVTREHLKILRAARDLGGAQLEVITLESPAKTRSEFAAEEFAAGYINFYVCNGAVIAPEFGDPSTDGRCRTMLEKLFPKRAVIQLNVDGIAAGGGGIHCTTQQEPDAKRVARG